MSPPVLAAAVPLLHTLPNGVRLVVVPMPPMATATVSVFVRSGSAHESRRESGISHVVEHMLFKGTAERDARRINLDAERLGAEVNAHTDKDHTALHMRGLPQHVPLFVRMLGELVLAPTFPAEELQRERTVLLHEYTEDEDDPMSTAFKLFDKASFGTHPAAQPVIGSRQNIERFTREDLAAWVQRQYSGANTVVAVAGPVDPDAVLRDALAVFAPMREGTPNRVAAPAWHGGIHTCRLDGTSQAHVVLGFPLAPLPADDPAGAMAAALLGDGMSSPLLEALRERRALAYYCACSADVLEICGQFVVEVSTSPEQLDATLRELARLLAQQARAVDDVDLERARNQVTVRTLRNLERPLRRLEDAALEVFALGRLRAPGEALARLHALDAAALRDTFAAMLGQRAALALAGKLPRAASERAREAMPGIVVAR